MISNSRFKFEKQKTDGSISQLLFNIKFILIMALPILFSTCKGEGLGFRMTYQQDFEIQAGLGVFDTHVFQINRIPTNKDFFLSNNDATESDVTEIVARDAALSINFSDVDFVFVREVVVEIFNQDNRTGKEIFFRENIPLNTGARIDLVPSLPDVKEFLMEDEFNVRIELRLRDISPQFIETRFDFQFFARLE